MPFYEYQCQAHGTFEKRLPLEQSSEPACCPSCGESCKKVFTAPALRGLSRAVVQAHEKNERSRVSPKVCGSGCQHEMKPRSATAKKGGLHSYKGKRPWVIEHA